MYLIVGLGNHEKQYHTHRHNVGFMLVDYIASLLHGSIVDNNGTIEQSNNGPRFKHENKLQTEIFKASYLHHDIILAKPQTFMNQSGDAVNKILNYWKLDVDSLIVVHDDLDIPLGKFHIQKGVGPLMHNGLSSIEQRIGTKDFWRVRIGIENRPVGHHISGEAYVLENFNPEEQKIVDETLPKIFHLLKSDLLKS